MPTNRTRRSYDLRKIMLVVGGYDIGGYADGGATIEWGSDLATVGKSIDGQVTAVQNWDESAMMTITLKSTSTSAKDLMGLVRTQLLTAGAIPDISVLMRDTNSGDEIKSGDAFFTKMPAPSLGADLGDRAFEICLPNARSTVKLAANY